VKGGAGSIFWFEIALPVMEVAVEITHPPEPAVTGYRGPRRVVLVADDLPSNRALIVDLLKPLGFDVLEATDGQQAILLARQMRPDLILMDRWMPVLDGLEAARRMRQMPELAGVPIVGISASVSEEDQALSREAGMDALLPKPIDWPRLVTLLEEQLGLEWESVAPARGAGDGEESGRVREDKEEGAAALVPPPQAELAVLLDLARMGNVRAIRERAAYIEKLGEQYVPFASKLRRLAEGFEERQILALIKQCMEAE
jgi:CheY-like chemotaxis protein